MEGGYNTADRILLSGGNPTGKHRLTGCGIRKRRKKMKEKQPTWPQMAVMLVPAAVMVACAYLLSNRREALGGAAWILALTAALSFIGFFVALYFFYLRPQYGSRAPLHLALFILGHGALVLLLWKAGTLG